MKKYLSMTAILLAACICTVGCGKSDKGSTSSVKVSVESVNNKTVEELREIYQGAWETSVVFVDNHDGIAFDIDKYELEKDGSGSFMPQNGKKELLSWTVTPDGNLQVLFEEKGEKSIEFEYVSGNLVSLVQEDRGMVETHLIKTGGTELDKKTGSDLT